MNVLLLDRDGVLTVEHPYIRDPDLIQLLPGVTAGLKRFRGWKLFVVTNQSAVGRGLCAASDVEACNERLRELLSGEGIVLTDIVFCPHHPDARCACRKPGLGMWEELKKRHRLEPEQCVMVGNRDSDTAFARNIGCMAALIEDPTYPLTVFPDMRVKDIEELADILLGAHDDRVMTVADASAFAAEARTSGKRVVTTNGAFDLLHHGHRFLLREARRHGDMVIVGVNSDAGVRNNKGPDRPVEKQDIRARKVARIADAVFLFDDPDPREWLKVIRPDAHLNAESYGENCVEAPVLREIGAKLILVPVKQELGSTTDILRAS